MSDKKQVPKIKHRRAFQLWMEGAEFSEIAEELKVSIYTIQSWSSHEKWRVERKRLRDEEFAEVQEGRRRRLQILEQHREVFQQTIFESIRKDVENITQIYIKTIYMSGVLVHEVIKSYFTQFAETKKVLHIKKGAEELSTFIKMLSDIAKVQNIALPDMPQELLEEMTQQYLQQQEAWNEIKEQIVGEASSDDEISQIL